MSISIHNSDVYFVDMGRRIKVESPELVKV
jgi:hypothetical protein